VRSTNSWTKKVNRVGRSRLNRTLRASRVATRSSTSPAGTFPERLTSAGVRPGLQQARHHNRLKIFDRHGLVLVVDQGDELLGQVVAVLLEPARGVPLPAQREQPVPLRDLDPAHPQECGDVHLAAAALARQQPRHPAR
jgi:hypothetical protein